VLLAINENDSEARVLENISHVLFIRKQFNAEIGVAFNNIVQRHSLHVPFIILELVFGTTRETLEITPIVYVVLEIISS
jgi:hypothetical protein